ncbi:class I SAM-dependent methyltransferase [Lysobacter pythonis]|uniref:Class I SAM-dependent methyltransferase n=1 Tax=Solilutibacter pythonis TaxID=2483112 RepID=A0A3M2I211_9GAMM|nr:class I SAM-dependent methyltransferase [Lysobacter pythonis]RMH93212.1 class I SAM-dependent methyltransferase [Lysobacter pythonis]
MKPDTRALARAFLDPARPFDRHHYYYARGKLATDPLYGGVQRALAGGDLPILDIGCGIGILLHWLRAAGIGAPYLGTDYDTRKIAQARAALARTGLDDARFESGDAARGLPAHSGHVCILDVLQFLPDTDTQDALLGQAIERLAPGGKLVIRTGLDDGGARARITVAVDRLSKHWGWMRARPQHYPKLEQLRGLFGRAGLDAEFTPLHGKTPFNNWLVVARKPVHSP